MSVPVVAGFTFTNPGVATSTTPAVLAGGLDKPAGVQPGDLLLMFVAMDITFTPTWSLSAGWTQIGSTVGDSGSDVFIGMFYRVANGTEPANETIEVSNAGSNYYMIGWYLRVTGADIDTPIDVTGTGATASFASSFPVSTVTTVTDDSLAFSFVAFDGADDTVPVIEQTGVNWSQTYPTDQLQKNPSASFGGGTTAGWLTKAMETAGAAGDATYASTAVPSFPTDGWSHLAFAVRAQQSTYALPLEEDDTVVATGQIDIVATTAATETDDTVVAAALGYQTPGTGAATETNDTGAGVGYSSTQIGLFATLTTLAPPDQIGVSVDTPYATADHTVIAGTTSRTAGAAAILTGDYAYRGLYLFDTTVDSPGDFQTDGRGWVTLASWGDFSLLTRRRAGSTYDLRAEFVTATSQPAAAQAQFNVTADDPRRYGLGVTRDATTGEIVLWLSTDEWARWAPLSTVPETEPTGALPDSAGEDIVILGGDLQDGAWLTAFRAQWGATTDITDVDANEVIAWNYGPSIVTGVGGNFYDDFDRDVYDSWAFGSNTSFVYQQRSETTDAGTTIRADFTVNAATLNTSLAPAGTEAAFSLDTSPQWVNGPDANVVGPAVLFTGTMQFSVNNLTVEPVPDTTIVVDYDGGTGTLPSSGDPITWTDGGSGTVATVDSGDATTGTITVTYDSGPTAISGSTVTSGGWSATAGSIVLNSYDGSPPTLEVRVVSNTGVVQYVLDNAAVGAITWGLNEPEVFSFRMPTLDPLNAQLSVAYQEVQIWRGSALLVWGVIVRSQAEPGIIDYQCRGLSWYFTKRFIGGPRNNFLENPSFETLGAWYAGLAPTESPAGQDPANWSLTWSTDRSLTGFPGRSMRLSSNSTTYFGVQAFQWIFHEIDTAEWPDGIKWTAAAWAYIPSADWGEYDAEADAVIGERNAAYNWGGESAPFGLHLGRFSTTESQDLTDIVVYPPGESYPKVYEIAVAGLTEDTPRDQWVRLEVSLIQPSEPGGGKRTDWIQVDLHCPIGVVYWDEVSLTRNERLFFNDVPQEDILAGLVEHAQDVTFGKSDLNIGIADVPASGVTRTRSYEFFNRELVIDALSEFPTLWKGCDWSIECTATERNFTVWSPMKGSYRPALALDLDTNIASITVATDGEQFANRVVVMSDGGGTGSSREEAIGTAGEPTVILEEAINATKESPLDSLDGQLQQALRQKENVVIPVLTTYQTATSILLGRLSTGDVVPVEASYGGLSISGDYRVVAITYDPVTETLDIAVNPYTDYQDPYL